MNRPSAPDFGDCSAWCSRHPARLRGDRVLSLLPPQSAAWTPRSPPRRSSPVVAPTTIGGPGEDCEAREKLLASNHPFPSSRATAETLRPMIVTNAPCDRIGWHDTRRIRLRSQEHHHMIVKTQLNRTIAVETNGITLTHCCHPRCSLLLCPQREWPLALDAPSTR